MGISLWLVNFGETNLKFPTHRNKSDYIEISYNCKTLVTMGLSHASNWDSTFV